MFFICSFSLCCKVSWCVQILCATFPRTYQNEKNYLHLFSDRFFSVSAALSCFASSTRIWPVWSVIFAWLMSQKVGLLRTAQQFFVNDSSSVWECEWETFKEVFYVKAKANNINSTWGMKQRQVREGKREENLFQTFLWTCSLLPHWSLQAQIFETQMIQLWEQNSLRIDWSEPFNLAEMVMLPFNAFPKPDEKHEARSSFLTFWSNICNNIIKAKRRLWKLNFHLV